MFNSFLQKTLGSGKIPIIFNVNRIRDGRNFVFRSVQLIQEEEVIYHCEFTFRKVSTNFVVIGFKPNNFQRPKQTDLKITQVRFPSVPEPERLQTVEELREEYQKQGYGPKRESHGVAFKGKV